MKSNKLHFVKVFSVKFFFLIIFLFSVLNIPFISAQESELTAPWNELKELMHLDENSITLTPGIFQKLVSLAGGNIDVMSFSNDEKVIISRSAFNKLLENINSETGIETINSEYKYVISRAVYSGVVNKNNILFEAVFDVYNFSSKEDYLKIPLIRSNIAIGDVVVNGKKALIVTEQDYHNIMIRESGENIIKVTFSLKYSLENGPHKVDIPVLKTPITLINFELPITNINVEILQAQQLEISTVGRKTLVSGIVNSCEDISIHWRKKIPVSEKLPPKIYCETYSLLSILDNSLQTSSELHYNILHSEIDEISLYIPENSNILRVWGDGINDWQEIIETKDSEEYRILRVPFAYGKKGNIIVYIEYEQPFFDNNSEISFSGLETIGIEREVGYLGLELNTSAEVVILDSMGLEITPIHKLPEVLYNKSTKPLIQALKYIKHPYALTLDIKKHNKISMPVATINQANIITLITEDGKIIYHLTYHVKNCAKQFLEIKTPEDADIWSVFVDNNPVEPSMKEDGTLLVPLNRSNSNGTQLNAFPVEIIYCLPCPEMSVFNEKSIKIPSVDLFISRIIWSLYLPNDYWYFNFDSTLEKEEITGAFGLFLNENRTYNKQAMDKYSVDSNTKEQLFNEKQLNEIYTGNDYKSSFRNFQLDEQLMNSQISAELNFNNRLKKLEQNEFSGGDFNSNTIGLLPIEIEIPTGGQVYRFARTIIKTEDPLSLKILYAHLYIKTIIEWLLIIIFFGFLFLIRKPAFRLLQNIKSLLHLKKNIDESISIFFKSWITAIIFFIVFILSISSGTSIYISSIFLLMLLISIFMKFKIYLKKNKLTKKVIKSKAKSK